MAERILSRSRHEPRDVAFKWVLIGASLIAAALAVVLLAGLWVAPNGMTDQYVTRPLPRFAAPQLQPSPRADMQAFRAEQMRQLNETYWLDQTHGVIHLPIEQAMRKVAQEGIADWPTPAPAAAK